MRVTGRTGSLLRTTSVASCDPLGKSAPAQCTHLFNVISEAEGQAGQPTPPSWPVC